MPTKSKLTHGIRCFVSCVFMFIFLVPPMAAHAHDPLRIVTTSTIMADLVRVVAQDHGTVTSLVKVGVDPHTYQPVPADLETILRADIIFVHGVGLDRRIAQVISRSQTTAAVHTVTAGLEPRTVASSANTHDHGHDHDHDHHHDHDEGDPHFWFDPLHVQVYVDNIAKALATADPNHADAYFARAAAYQEELLELDAWIRAQVQQIPSHRKKLVTNHDTLGYFADRYGFEVVGSLYPNFSSDTQPSARQLAILIQAFDEAGVKTLFSETTLSPRLINTVARELGRDARVVRLYTESLSDEDGPASTYLAFMRYNVEQIVQALNQDAK